MIVLEDQSAHLEGEEYAANPNGPSHGQPVCRIITSVDGTESKCRGMTEERPSIGRLTGMGSTTSKGPESSCGWCVYTRDHLLATGQ